jgi:SAM-dependent methyltransferase
MATYDPSQTGNYYILGDTDAETVHLVEVDKYFNRSIGGLLPEQPEQSLSRIHRVLDIACGPGGWVLELAQAYPHMQVTGFDISEKMIGYARTLARANKFDNAQFQVASAMDPLDFPDDSFDLVNTRHIEEVIPVSAFAPLFKEMFRITRPGGIVRITGSEWGVTNSFAFEQLIQLIFRAAQIAGLDFSPDGRNTSITPRLYHFLRDVGCVNVQERPSFMDFSAGSGFSHEGFQLWSMSYELIEPFFLGTGVTTKEELEQLRRRLSIEMLEDSFRGIIYTLTAWGQKP